MQTGNRLAKAVAFGVVILLAACGQNGIFSGNNPPPAEEEDEGGTSLFDLFRTQDDPNTTLEVNKYIWNASLEVLNFLPIQTADPFSGLIVTGFGTPPGGRTAYRATILVNDPALDARSLNLSLSTRSGPVSDATRVAIENAILTRARQLRIGDFDL